MAMPKLVVFLFYFMFYFKMLCDLLCGFGEIAETTTAIILGGIHRDVGILEKLIQVVSVSGINRDADTG